MTLLTSCRPGIDTKAVDAAIERQLADFPESRLQDLYKSFFQDRFGPGHIIDDRAGALRYIESELQEAGAGLGAGAYSEPCGWEGNYLRISLRAVQDGTISAEELTDALVQSAIPVEEGALEAWKAEWTAILARVKLRHPDIPGMEEDSRTLDSLIASGQYAYHHSEAYEKAYHPHYRIIKRNLAEKLLFGTAGK